VGAAMTLLQEVSQCSVKCWNAISYP